MSEYFIVYITCGDTEEANKIACYAIENKLAACANILAPHQSLYFWEGAVQNDQEVALILKTSKKCYPALEKAIKKLHSYDLPCIVAMPIEQGNPDFLSFIDSNTCA